MAKIVKHKYVTNKELLPEVEAYRKSWDEETGKGEPSEDLGRMILLIATRYAEKG